MYPSSWEKNTFIYHKGAYYLLVIWYSTITDAANIAKDNMYIYIT